MTPIQFSIVIPLYNKRNNILATLNSVREQRYQASEIIVVDDGSTDDGAALVEALDWPELALVRTQNQGVSAARNQGTEIANSPFVAFLDADDQWSPFFLYEMQRLIRRFPGNGLYACRYQKMVNNTTYSDAKIALTNLEPAGYEMDNYFELASRGDLPFMISSSVMDKRYLKSIGGFPVGEWMGEDQSVFVQAAVDNKIAYSPQIRLNYHVDADNRVSELRPPAEACPFAEKVLAMIDNNSVAGTQKKHAYAYVAAHICNLAKRNVHAGIPSVARDLLRNPVSSHKPVHRVYWYSRAVIHSLKNTFTHRATDNLSLGA